VIGLENIDMMPETKSGPAILQGKIGFLPAGGGLPENSGPLDS
jgi:hypothetical protein